MKPALQSAPELLDAWHQQRGARWREMAGRRVVTDYGDSSAEQAELRRGCGLVDRRWIASFTVSGEDRRRFLNGYLTCDVGSLEPGSGAYGFFTSTQGRVLADAVVAAEEKRLRVEVAAGRVAPLIEHLNHYILADRVVLEPGEEEVRWSLVGPGAAAVLSALELAPPAEIWSSKAAVTDAGALIAQRGRELGVPVFELVATVAQGRSIAEALIAAGARPAGFGALETLRVEEGVARFGADFDERNFPQETGLEEAVSYTKGCYLGQEVVARIHYRGRVNHELRGVALASGEGAAAGAAIEFEGEEVGRLGSLVDSPAAGGVIGLAILHRKAAEIGTQVIVLPDIEARVERPGRARD